ncbi:MAG: hypothetical protein E7562_06530 [Ruminococcaceae bacterium]|nr:hypothetical protein [Oscillospiraceae bacterium]
MKRFFVFFAVLAVALMLCGCSKAEEADKKENIFLSVMQDGEQLDPSKYDMMITVDGNEIEYQKTKSEYKFEKQNGEIKGSVKFPDWVEVEYGFVNEDYSDISIKISFEHRKDELYASQSVTAVKNGEKVELFNENTADINESQISVFIQ